MDYYRSKHLKSSYSSKHSGHKTNRNHDYHRDDHRSGYYSPPHHKRLINSTSQRSHRYMKNPSYHSRHRNHDQNHNHYYTYHKRYNLDRSRESSLSPYKSSKYHTHYHNKYNHRIHSRVKPPKISYKSKSNYSSNNKSSSDLSSNNKLDKDHYKYTVGEIVGGRFKLTKFICDGTFGRVLDCEDIQSSSKQKYAIKIIRPVTRYIESAEIEANIILDINKGDTDNESYCIKMIDAFHFKKMGDLYYAIVFERVGLSLFEFIKTNNYRGFTIRQIQEIAYQILKGIGYLHKKGIVHTDLKPENILLVDSSYTSVKDKNDWPTNVISKEEKTNSYSPSTRSYSKENEDNYRLLSNPSIKIIDFGGAIYSKQDHHGTINTRQYRSPEVIMECFEWDEKSDVWSIACILSELYTGELLFATHDNHEHLCLIEKVCGMIPYEMSKTCCSELKNMFVLKDDKKKLSNICVSKLTNSSKIIKSLSLQEELEDLILPEHNLFRELLHSLLTIDPKKRPGCLEALEHPFFKYNFKK